MSYRTSLFNLLILFVIFSFPTCYADELDYKTNEIIVRFASKENKTKYSKHEKNKFLSDKNCGYIKKEFKKLPGVAVVILPKDKKVKDAIKELRNSKAILYVEPNYKIYPLSTFPNDPNFPEQWGLHNTGELSFINAYWETVYASVDADIDAPEAWDLHTDASNVIVAVTDTGVDYTHPDLSGSMWINPVEWINGFGDPNDLNGDGYPGIGGVDDDGDGLIDEDSQGNSRFLQDGVTPNPSYTNDIPGDDDENGYVDDIYGYDFGGYVENDEDCDPNDPDGHGTHVSGTIGAIGNNNIGVAGVCWYANIMALKIFPPYYVNEWVAFVDNAIEAIEYAVDNEAKVINASWGLGSNYSQTLKDAIDEAGDEGVLFIAASGNNIYDGDWNVVLNNDASPHYPSSYDCDNIIAVMASDYNDNRSQWNAYNESHYGAISVDIAAPGSDILSCVPGEGYESWGGTSMATPHVSGACALIWSMYPHLQALQVKQIILDSADKLDSLNGLCVSEGRLNLYQALLHAHPLNLEIQDDIADPNGCVIPGDDITFTITYGNPSPTDPNDPNYFGPAENVEIQFPLPDAIDPNINHPNYVLLEGIYVWEVGTLYPGDSNSITFTVSVNENAEPLGEIKSKVKMYSSIGYGEDQEETGVCCWGGDRIYVDAYATGSKTGVTWDNAYTDLQDALQRAAQGCGTEEIWVAQGIYRPTKTRDQNASFDMVDSLEIYGGFRSDANSLSERDFVKYKTYLSGNIDIGGDLDSFIVINTDPDSEISSDTILDGFIITHSTEAGIYCNEADLVVRNCVLTDNDANGINIYKSNPYIFDSVITDNAAVGVYDCNESLVTIEGCVISKNGANGISCRKNAAVTLKNSWIHNNEGEGIALTDAASGSTIRNNTIVYNMGKGIFAESGYAPTVKNCIVWGNENGDISGCSATYSCFDGGTGSNIDDDPNFVCLDPSMYNYHLRFGSPCRDVGDGYYPEEYDIDREPREYGSEIDMGADEIYCTDSTLDDTDVYKALDWNSDGLVNMHEFSYFSAAWLSHDPNDPEVLDPNSPVNDPNDPLYIDPNRLEGWYEWKYMCNLDDTVNTATEYEIDLADLDVFWNDWLWKACYVSFDTWMHTFGEVEGDTDEMYGSQTSTEMTLNTKSQDNTVDMKPNVEPQNDTVAIEEKSIKEQFLEIQEIATFLENLWNEDPAVREEMDAKQWADFMNIIYEWMDTLEGQLLEQ